MSIKKPITTHWFDKGQTEKEKEEYSDMLRSSLALRKLKEIVLQTEANFERQEIRSDVYDCPSWAYKQADSNGYRRMLNHMKELLSFVDEL